MIDSYFSQILSNMGTLYISLLLSSVVSILVALGVPHMVDM